MCRTRHFVYIFFNPVFRLSTAKNEINLFNNHVLIVAPVTFAPAGAMTPSAEFLLDTSGKTNTILFSQTNPNVHECTQPENKSKNKKPPARIYFLKKGLRI